MTLSNVWISDMQINMYVGFEYTSASMSFVNYATNEMLKWLSAHKLLKRINACKLKNGEQMTDCKQLKMEREWDLTKWDEAYQHKW